MAFHQMGNTIATSSSFMTYFWASINPGALMLTLISPSMGDALTELSGVKFPVWITYLVVYILIIVLSLSIAIKKLRANMKSNR